MSTMSPYKSDTPTFVDNKREPWGPELCHERQ